MSTGGSSTSKPQATPPAPVATPPKPTSTASSATAGLTAAPSNPKWSGPLIITKGGTYSGNWQSLDPNKPAVSVDTSQPVIIRNSIIRSASDLIATGVNHTNLTVINTAGYGLNPNIKGHSPGRFINDFNFDNIVIENNTLDGTAGIELGQYSGNHTAQQTIKVLYNSALNIDGRHSNGSGSFLTGPDDNDLVQFVQLNACLNVPGVEIAWNQVVNLPGQSRVEDNISVFQSSGTASSPILIHDNYIAGAYAAAPTTDTSFTGGGIMLSDGYTHSAATDTGFVQAYGNIVVGTSNYGIAISSGHDDSFYGNTIISSGLLPNGTAIASQNVAAYIWNSGGDPYFARDSAWGNSIGWMNQGAHGRNDQWMPNASGKAGDSFLPGTITLKTEQAQYAGWLKKVAGAGVKLG